MAQSDQLKDFRDGLYEILLAGNVDAFSRYLRQWEELIGDTAELGETSEAQQRRTMDALLRRPQQYNLPPWPRHTPPSVTARPPVQLVPASPVGDTRQPLPISPGAASTPTAPMPPASPHGPLHAGSVTPQKAGPGSSVYQVDLITGELVPVKGVEKHPGQENQYDSSPVRVPGPASPRRARKKRVRGIEGMKQLTMWDDYDGTNNSSDA